jgi:hypothetical protein
MSSTDSQFKIDLKRPIPELWEKLQNKFCPPFGKRGKSSYEALETGGNTQVI